MKKLTLDKKELRRRLRKNGCVEELEKRCSTKRRVVERQREIEKISNHPDSDAGLEVNIYVLYILLNVRNYQ